MIVQITYGPPLIPYAMSERNQQMYDYCATSGEVWAGWVNDELEAVWGVIPSSFMSDQAYIWMMDLPIKHPIILARYSRKVMDALLYRWPILFGHCRYGTYSTAWLGWLGAEFGQPREGLVPFEIRRSVNG